MKVDAKSSRVRVGTVELHVQEWGGQGDVVLLAHPTGFLGAIWLPLIRRLRAAGFAGRIITFDQRGHGLSSKPDSGYEWPNFVDDACALIETLGLKDIIGVGHSAGATVLACAAARAPGRFRRLVMIDPILYEPDFHEVFRSRDNTMSARTRTRRLVWASREELATSYAGRQPYDTWAAEALHAYVDHGTFERPDGEIELLCPGRIEAQVYENSASMDSFAALRQVPVPVLLVRGAHSESFNDARARRALGCLANGRLVTVEATTHYVPMERVDETARLVLAEITA